MRIINPICIYGSIRPDVANEKFVRELSSTVKRTRPRDKITFCINSQGGDTNTGFGVYDLIRGCGRKTVGLVIGTAQSAASMVLQACESRVMTRHSSLMFHGMDMSVSGSVDSVTSTLQRFSKMDELMFGIYAHRTGKTLQEIIEMARRDYLFDADAALEYGLIDKIV